jgi:glycosyltransferase involved in cell wall biosynthesis
LDSFIEEIYAAKSPIELTIYMPCFNEEKRVAGALEKSFASADRTNTAIEVIVFDDCSTDRTSEVVRDYQKRFPDRNIRLITLPKNRGLGRNFIDGAFIGKGNYYRTVAGDDYEFPESHDAIMRALGEADIIIPAYRDVIGRSLMREILSKTFTAIVNLISGNSIEYYNGFPAYRRWQVMRFAVESTGFGFQAEMITRFIGEGATYKEIPLKATAQPGSKALRLRNFVSVGFSLVRILARRVSRAW